MTTHDIKPASARARDASWLPQVFFHFTLLLYQ
jgi:hypothetical protein